MAADNGRRGNPSGRPSRPSGGGRGHDLPRGGPSAVGRPGGDRRVAGAPSDRPRTDRERHDARPQRSPRLQTGPPPVEHVWPEGMETATVDRSVIIELSTLPELAIERVTRHLTAAGLLVDEDPAAALVHAIAAQDLAPRHACVREAVGISAYLAGDYPRARSALRSWRRMTGRPDHLALLADTERAMGDPGRALDVVAEATGLTLDLETRVEVAIVASGARRDLGQALAAATLLEALVTEVSDASPVAGRLLFAWGEALREAGKVGAARSALLRAASLDEDLDDAVAEALEELDPPA